MMHPIRNHWRAMRRFGVISSARRYLIKALPRGAGEIKIASQASQTNGRYPKDRGTENRLRPSQSNTQADQNQDTRRI